MNWERQSPMSRAVRQCYCGGGTLTGGDGGVRGWGAYEFGTDFAGFAGHFPGDPLVPGVCLIIAAEQAVNAVRREPWQLTGVRQIKYFRPVRPGTAVRIEFETDSRPERGIAVTATVRLDRTESAETIAKLRLEGRLL